MTNLWSKVSPRGKRALSAQGWVDLITLKQNQYLIGTNGPALDSTQESVENSYAGFAEGVYKRNPIIFGCMQARSTLFTEARFQYRRLEGGRLGELFGDKSLAVLEEPWPGASTGDLLAWMMQDTDLAGNFFALRIAPGMLKRLRPDWCSIILGTPRGTKTSAQNPEAVPIGYGYTPGGSGGGNDMQLYLAEQVVHWAPIRDPLYAYRGMSWLTPVVREVQADNAGTEHKLQYLENGATPNMIVKTDAGVSPEDFVKFKELFEEEHGGLENAYGTVFLGGGADMEVVGSSMREVDFKAVQAQGENRICVAARVPGIIAGTTEGLDAATYSNFGQARRAFTDGTMSPLWRSACGALDKLVTVPGGALLWYDVRDIPYLQEDRKDEAEIQKSDSVAMEVLIKAGFEPDSVVKAITGHDMNQLVHSGLVSVQLHAPGEGGLDSPVIDPAAIPPPANGNGAPPPPVAAK